MLSTSCPSVGKQPIRVLNVSPPARCATTSQEFQTRRPWARARVSLGLPKHRQSTQRILEVQFDVSRSQTVCCLPPLYCQCSRGVKAIHFIMPPPWFLGLCGTGDPWGPRVVVAQGCFAIGVVLKSAPPNVAKRCVSRSSQGVILHIPDLCAPAQRRGGFNTPPRVAGLVVRVGCYVLMKSSLLLLPDVFFEHPSRLGPSWAS